MSFKLEILDEGKWIANALRFATEAEATAYGNDLGGRWSGAHTRRVAESDEPVSHTVTAAGHAIPIEDRAFVSTPSILGG